MLYGFIRITPSDPHARAQRRAVEAFCASRKSAPAAWLKEDASTLKPRADGALDRLFKPLKEGDTIVCECLHRAGGSLAEFSDFIHAAHARGATLIFAREQFYVHHGKPNAESFLSLATFFASLAADLDGQRGEELQALYDTHRPRPGHPGGENARYTMKLYPLEGKLKELLAQGVPVKDIATTLGVSPGTVDRYIKRFIFPRGRKNRGNGATND